MNLFLGYLLVFILSAVPFFEAYAVIAIASITGLSVIPVMGIGLAGNILTVFVMIFFVEQIRNWRKKRKEGKEIKESKRSVRAQKLWGKYGLPGLAMFGPLIVGSHLTALASMTFGGAKKNTFYWVSASITIWSVVFTVLLFYGVDFLGLEDSGIVNVFKNMDK